jgi:flagellar motility protein MotE (MotC chaperone)
MMKYLIMLVAGAALFGASAAVSMVLRPKPVEELAEDGAAENEARTEEAAHEQTAELTPTSHSAIDLAEIPENGLAAVTVLRLSESIRKREQQLIEREKQITEQERRLKFMIDDLQRERTEISALMEQAENKAAEARSFLEAARQAGATTPVNTTADGEQPATAPGNQLRELPENEKQNLKTVAEWLKGMPPETAAQSIRELSNEGKMEMAVQLLSFLEDRDAANILSALDDTTLFTQLADRFRDMPRPKKPEK